MESDIPKGSQERTAARKKEIISAQNLADNAGSGTWLDGKRLGAGASEDEIRAWIEGQQ